MIEFLLAAAETAPQGGGQTQIVPLDFIWEQITSLTWLQAVIGISFGMVYLLYGWRIFRIMVVICFAFAGMYAGMLVGQRLGGQGSELWGGVIGVCAAAAVSMSLIKWGVSVLGAAAGGIVTGGLWYAFGLPEQYIWAGAVIGIVAGGLMSFILLKISVMLFTSLGGSVILGISFLALLYQYQTKVMNPPSGNIHEMMFGKTWFLPLIIIVPTMIGMVVQNKLIKKSSEWDF
ncbi:MAG: hypothetical protein FJ263_04070 [Planctomycetes bacterium]|nr:hypothetical protein [Planctomycetota bacterium]